MPGRIEALVLSLAEPGRRIIHPGAGGADLADSFLLDFLGEPGDDLVDGHRAEVAIDSVAHRDGVRRLLLLADHQHVGHLLQLRLADLVPDLLWAIVAG